MAAAADGTLDSDQSDGDGRMGTDNVIMWGEARVAELADALALGASSRKGVEVRVLSRAPKERVCFKSISCDTLAIQGYITYLS